LTKIVGEFVVIVVADGLAVLTTTSDGCARSTLWWDRNVMPKSRVSCKVKGEIIFILGGPELPHDTV